MRCPSCSETLERLEFRSIEVDQCRVCRGLWLDHQEVDQLFALPQLPQRLLNHERYHTPNREIPEGQRQCPRCLRPLLVIEVDGIRLDACPGCQGFFCDLGEFALLEEAAVRRAQQASKSRADAEG